MSIELVMMSNHLILCRPLLPPTLNLSQHHGVFSSEPTLPIMWPKYWSFGFSISPSNEYLELISFKIDQFDLPAVQGTLKRLLQHHDFKALILWISVFFMVQLSHSLKNKQTNKHQKHCVDYVDLHWKSDVSAFQYVVQFCHSFPPKEHVSFNFMAAFTILSDFTAQENKICHCFTFPPSMCHEVMGLDAMIFIFAC